MIKAVMFDLDGTLADSLESISSAGNKVLMEFGFEPLPKENYKYYAGDGAAVLVERCLKDAGDKELKHYEAVYARYQEIFKEDCTYKVSAFTGMPETLRKLKEKNIRLAVISNKPHERALDVVKRLFEPELFDCVLGLKEGQKRKPDPNGALMAAKQFDAKPEECLFIGDTNVDMQTGRNAGMIKVGVLWGFRTKEELEENGADYIISTPEELMKIV